MKHSDDIQLRDLVPSSGRWKGAGALPVAAFLILMIFINARESSAVFESPILLALLNTVFLCVIPLAIAYMAAKSHHATGVFAFLILGCGLVFFGVSSLYAGWVMPLAGNPNPTVTLHNLGSLFAGICQFVGAHFFLQELTGVSETRPRRVKRYGILYVVIFILVSITALLAFWGNLPIFFDPLMGPSILRQLVLGTAICLFAVSGLVFLEIYSTTKTEFAYWYGLALWLIAIGLTCVLLQPSVGSMIGWTGRGAQYIGSVYFIFAFLWGHRELPAQDSTSSAKTDWELWPYLEHRVKERTAALVYANDAMQKEIAEHKQVEEQLRKTRENLTLAIHSANVGLWDWDLFTNKVYFSPEWKSQLGFEDHEIADDFTEWESRVHPDDVERANATVNAYLANSYPNFQNEFRLRHKDGSYRWILAEASLLFDEQGKPIRMLGSHIDITERKQAESALLQANERLSFAQRSASAGVWDWDIKTGKLNWSPEFFHLFGLDFEKQDAAFDTWRGVLHPDDLQLAEQRISDAVRDHQPLYNEYRIVMPSGEIRWIGAWGDISYDEHGEALRMTGLCIDITERKQAEEALRENEQNLCILFETMTEGISLNEIIYDENGEMVDYRILKVNPAFYSLADYSGKIVIGGLATKLYGMSPEFIKEFWKQHKQKNSTAYTEMNSPISDKVFFIATSPFVKDRFVTSFFDITERKRAEQRILYLMRLYATLSQVNQTIVRVSHQKELFDEICRVAIEFGEFRLAWVGLFDPQSGDLTPAATHGYAGIKLPFTGFNANKMPFKGGLTGMAISSGQVQYSHDLQVDPRMTHWREAAIQGNYHSAAAIPLRQNGQVIGLLNLYAPDVDFFTSEDEQSLLKEMGMDISFALDNLQRQAERRKAEKILQDLIDKNPMAIQVVDEKGFTLKVNPAHTRLFGSTPPADYSMFSSFKNRPKEFRELLERVINNGEVVHFPDLYSNAHDIDPKVPDVPLWIRTTCFPLNDSHGKPEQIVFVYDNITESRQAEEKLRESEDRYHRLVENVPDIVYKFSNQRGGIYYSPCVEQILGYSAEHLYAHPMLWNESVHPEDRPRIAEIIGDFEVGKPFDIEYRIRDAQGNWRWLRDHSIGRAVGGGEVLIEGLATDITERKQAEQILRESEASLKFSQQVAHVGHWTWDTITNQVTWSDEMKRIFGLDPDIFDGDMGKVIAQAIHPDDREKVDASNATVLTEQRPVPMEYRVIWRDGSVHTVWAEAGKKILDAHGKILKLSGIVQDITQRKQYEIQIESQLKRLNALHNIDNAISSSFNLRITLDVFLNEVTAQLKIDAASVLLFNQLTNTLDYTAGRGFRSSAIRHTKLSLGQGFAGRVMLERCTIHIPDLDKEKSKLVDALSLAGENFATYIGAPLIAKGEIVGVLEVFHRTPLDPDSEWLDFLEILAGQAAIAIDNVKLFENVQRSNFELTIAYDATIEGWSRAMDLRDRETEGHTQRVTALTLRLARQMGVPETDLVHIRRGALLHDIGKLGVPDSILFKPGKLTDEEWEIMRQHPLHANNMLASVAYLKAALDIPYYHHEKWDGTGYPRGLKGDEIPLASRIFAVADVWDALYSNRPYRKAWPAPKIREYIREESGRHFDPRVVDVFMELIIEGI